MTSLDAVAEHMDNIFDDLETDATTTAHGLNGADSAKKRAAPQLEVPRSKQAKPVSLASPVAKACKEPTFKTQLLAAASEDKGCRNVMEDVWIAEYDARSDKESLLRVSFFAVFDGHGGRSVAELASQQLHKQVIAAGLLPTDGSQVDLKKAKSAITHGFKTTDELVLAQCTKGHWQDGACCVAAWVIGEHVMVANIGDARCVLARDPEAPTHTHDTTPTPASPTPTAATAPTPAAAAPAAAGAAPAGPRALTLSKEHLAIYPQERVRIEKAGGYIADGRLNGRIQVSRSFGDNQFKKCGASALPDCRTFEITPRDRFIIVACDGFWSVFDAQGAVDAVSKLLEEGRELKAVTNRLLNQAIRERRCKDNCTIMLVQFVHQQATDAGSGGNATGGSGPEGGGAAAPGSVVQVKEGGADESGAPHN